MRLCAGWRQSRSGAPPWPARSCGGLPGAAAAAPIGASSPPPHHPPLDPAAPRLTDPCTPSLPKLKAQDHDLAGHFKDQKIHDMTRLLAVFACGCKVPRTGFLILIPLEGLQRASYVDLQGAAKGWKFNIARSKTCSTAFFSSSIEFAAVKAVGRCSLASPCGSPLVAIVMRAVLKHPYYQAACSSHTKALYAARVCRTMQTLHVQSLNSAVKR